ncbi:hypothetical protein A8950_3339 [Dongia mobilis]|uniref:DUF2218 domain-containing protein n=1 Tax=Dongia mobilis TaxID=578943 RepID=A0A4R6WLK2_9PROT|nr:DUF2218 domain-containing protein [Dongia mobilis]TDQ78877.1 hypothetical protein A8950_3339 [Dongia mobilis]
MTPRTSLARVATASPARYLGQLCKHFAHRIPAAHDAESGWIEFPFGRCDLAADGEVLAMSVAAANDEDLARMEDVIARHLVRFAFREPPEIVWQRGEG